MGFIPTNVAVSKSANFTVDSAASIYLISALAANRTATLPLASDGAGAYTFIRTDDGTGSHTCTVARAGSDTIDGGTSVTLAPGEARTLVSDGVSAWYTTSAGLGEVLLTELTALAAAIPAVAVPDIAATTDITTVPGSFADVAAVRTYLAGANVIPNIETRLDNLESKLNAALAMLRTTHLLTP